jgi:hypothetical protein
MPTLAEVRAQYPQYGDMSDGALADALYRKFYSDLPRQEFDRKVGLAQASATAGSGPFAFLTDVPREAANATADTLSSIGENLNPFNREGVGVLEGQLKTGKGLAAVASLPARRSRRSRTAPP